jgi:hypothetical protein
MGTIELGRFFAEFETPATGGVSPLVKYSSTLRRPIRVGDLQAQQLSTYRLIGECLRGGAYADAAALGAIFEEEARVCWEPFQRQIAGARAFLRERGVASAELAAADAEILAKLAHPDGRDHDSTRLWHELRQLVLDLARICGQADADAALAHLDRLKEHWRQLHDRDCDHLAGLLNQILVRFGEDAILEVWLELEDWGFEWRYRQYDVSVQSWKDTVGGLVYITFESGRGHLMGAERTGDVEFEEHDDCWVWRWDPCGSCGRLLRGDAVEGTPPRMEPPYGWDVLQRAHPWTWGKRGVSPYGAHSCVKLGVISVERLGYPLRFVDCPTYPDRPQAKCSRYVYKDPSLVPDHVYERIGRKRPAQLRGQQP